MGTAFTPAKTSPASWDAFSDLESFVDAVLAELAAMAADGTRPTRSGPKPPLTGAALRKAIMAIWCVAFWGASKSWGSGSPGQVGDGIDFGIEQRFEAGSELAVEDSAADLEQEIGAPAGPPHLTPPTSRRSREFGAASQRALFQRRTNLVDRPLP